MTLAEKMTVHSPAPVTTTAFLTSIPNGLSDTLLVRILSTITACITWKRLTDPSGAPKSSGFAHFPTVEALSQALRLLPKIDWGKEARLAVKVEPALAALVEAFERDAVEHAAREEGEAGSLVFKEADIKVLREMAVILSDKRMLASVECVDRLVCKYESVFARQPAAAAHDPHYDGMEREWARQEHDVFLAFHEYQRKRAEATERPAEPRLRMFCEDRARWRRIRADEVIRERDADADFIRMEPEERVKRLAASIPTDTPALFDWPVHWIGFDQCRLREWLVEKRGLTVPDAERVCAYIPRRLGPGDIMEAVVRDGIVGQADADAFIVRLWRWIVFETELAKMNLSV